MTQQNRSRLIGVVRWLARFISALALIVVFMLALGKELPSLSDLSFSESIKYIGIAIILIGFILAWFKEMAGGILTLAGFVLFWILNGFEAAWFVWSFFLAGLMFIFCSRSARKGL